MDTALFLGLIWSGLWMAFLYVIMKCFPWEMLHDYPEDVRRAWLIIPGTENCSSYSDYGHHFKGFLIGCIYTTLMALIFAGIDYALLYFLMWK